MIAKHIDKKNQNCDLFHSRIGCNTILAITYSPFFFFLRVNWSIFFISLWLQSLSFSYFLCITIIIYFSLSYYIHYSSSILFSIIFHLTSFRHFSDSLPGYHLPFIQCISGSSFTSKTSYPSFFNLPCHRQCLRIAFSDASSTLLSLIIRVYILRW